MKKKLGQRKGIKILKRLAIGVIDPILPVKGVLAGGIEGVKRIVSENKLSEEGGKGKIDYVRLGSTVGTLGLIAAVTFGVIDIKMFKELMKYVMDLG